MHIRDEMIQYWSERVNSFSELRMKEYTGHKKTLWMNEIENYIPAKPSLKILDLGTGTGFFSFLLAEKGHHVVGIDITEKMITEALLKKDGILINFDADYCREDPKRCIPENHAHKNITTKQQDTYENMKEKLCLLQKPRPQWDAELLQTAGFHEISIDTGVWNRIYADYDEFYNPTPIFMLTAKA